MAPFPSFLVQRHLPLLSLLLLRRQLVRRTITALLTRAIFPEGKAQVPLDLLIAEHRVTDAGRNISSPRSAHLVEHAAAGHRRRAQSSRHLPGSESDGLSRLTITYSGENESMRPPCIDYREAMRQNNGAHRVACPCIRARHARSCETEGIRCARHKRSSMAPHPL